MNYKHFSNKYVITHYQHMSITDKIFIKDFLLNSNTGNHFFDSVCKEYKQGQLNFIEAVDRIIHYMFYLKTY